MPCGVGGGVEVLSKLEKVFRLGVAVPWEGGTGANRGYLGLRVRNIKLVWFVGMGEISLPLFWLMLSG